MVVRHCHTIPTGSSTDNCYQPVSISGFWLWDGQTTWTHISNVTHGKQYPYYFNCRTPSFLLCFHIFFHILHSFILCWIAFKQTNMMIRIVSTFLLFIVVAADFTNAFAPIAVVLQSRRGTVLHEVRYCEY